MDSTFDSLQALDPDRGARTKSARTSPREGRTLKVLVVGAHPDDLELACGGTVARMSDHGHDVHALVLSDGRVGGDSAIRRGEAMRGAEALGIEDITTHGLPDTRLSEHTNDLIAAVEKKVSAFHPDIILTHSQHDLHQDHQAVHLAVLRGSRARSSVLCFESPSVTRAFDPSIFVDVNGYLDTKIRAIREHENQSGKPYMDGEHVRSVAAFRGNQAKTRYAEGFEVVRLMLSDMVAF